MVGEGGIHPTSQLSSHIQTDDADVKGPRPTQGSSKEPLEVRRGAREGPALAAIAVVNGTEVEAIGNTGAEATLLSEAFYDAISASKVKARSRGPKAWLNNAEDGAAMEACHAEVRIQLGEFDRKWPVLVAPFREEVLIGLDLLQEADTEHIAWGLVECPSPTKEAVLNPIQLSTADVRVASAWVNMGARVPVRLANFAQHETRLEAGQLLGDLVETMPADVHLRQEPRREVTDYSGGSRFGAGG